MHVLIDLHNDRMAVTAYIKQCFEIDDLIGHLNQQANVIIMMTMCLPKLTSSSTKHINCVFSLFHIVGTMLSI